jgi:hypothetical protein
MNHFYRDVPKLGNIVITRHAQAQAEKWGITDEDIKRALFSPSGPDIPDGLDVIWRQANGVRLVVLTKPFPDRGAKVVKTVFRIQPQATPR